MCQGCPSKSDCLATFPLSISNDEFFLSDTPLFFLFLFFIPNYVCGYCGLTYGSRFLILGPEILIS